MKYVSIDLETTGVSHKEDSILEFGAIIEDTDRKLSYDDIPKFSCLINHSEIKGHPIALDMNARIINTLSEYHKIPSAEVQKKKVFKQKNKIIEPKELIPNFYNFLVQHYFGQTDRSKLWTANADQLKITVAGKSFDVFDRLFLGRFPTFDQYVKMQKRGIEPAHYFVNWGQDSELPNMSTCKTRAGLDGHVAHIALSDAWDVIRLLRKAQEKV